MGVCHFCSKKAIRFDVLLQGYTDGQGCATFCPSHIWTEFRDFVYAVASTLADVAAWMRGVRLSGGFWTGARQLAFFCSAFGSRFSVQTHLASHIDSSIFVRRSLTTSLLLFFSTWKHGAKSNFEPQSVAERAARCTKAFSEIENTYLLKQHHTSSDPLCWLRYFACWLGVGTWNSDFTALFLNVQFMIEQGI